MISFSRDLLKSCEEFPEAIVVFGDNTIAKGTAGQAIIRWQKNAFGVPTKKYPSLNNGSFFSDKEDEYNLVREKLVFLWKEHKKGIHIVLPEKVLGSGLAKMELKSPKIFELIKNFYKAAKEEK